MYRNEVIVNKYKPVLCAHTFVPMSLPHIPLRDVAMLNALKECAWKVCCESLRFTPEESREHEHLYTAGDKCEFFTCVPSEGNKHYILTIKPAALQRAVCKIVQHPPYSMFAATLVTATRILHSKDMHKNYRDPVTSVACDFPFPEDHRVGDVPQINVIATGSRAYVPVARTSVTTADEDDDEAAKLEAAAADAFNATAFSIELAASLRMSDDQLKSLVPSADYADMQKVVAAIIAWDPRAAATLKLTRPGMSPHHLELTITNLVRSFTASEFDNIRRLCASNTISGVHFLPSCKRIVENRIIVMIRTSSNKNKLPPRNARARSRSPTRTVSAQPKTRNRSRSRERDSGL